jgi:hypothetical protein
MFLSTPSHLAVRHQTEGQRLGRKLEMRKNTDSSECPFIPSLATKSEDALGNHTLWAPGENAWGALAWGPATLYSARCVKTLTFCWAALMGRPARATKSHAIAWHAGLRFSERVVVFTETDKGVRVGEPATVRQGEPGRWRWRIEPEKSRNRAQIEPEKSPKNPAGFTDVFPAS